jgi:hypothetical protein
VDDKKSHDLEALQNLWDEYKYRHNLIWQRIFIFTTAVVSISILPYIQLNIVERLGNWILIAPVLAVILALFMLLVFYTELELFKRIYQAYWHDRTPFSTTI